jgi:hypothetical protein
MNEVFDIEINMIELWVVIPNRVTNPESDQIDKAPPFKLLPQFRRSGEW